MSNQVEGFVKGILLGGVVGAVIGILFAPKSGKETRDDINRTAEELLAKAREEYEATLKKSGMAYEAAVKQLERLESSAKEKVAEMGEQVEELAEMGKDALRGTKGRLTKAVDAAVHVFK